MTELVYIVGVSTAYPPDVSERIQIKIDTLNNIFAAFNRDGEGDMLANNFDNTDYTTTHFITFKYRDSKRIRVQLVPYAGIFRLMFGVLAEDAPSDSLSSSHILASNMANVPIIVDASYSALLTVVSSATSITANYHAFDSSGNYGTILSGYTAKHMITGNRVMLINDMLPGSDVAVAGSTTQGIAIPRPSTLLAPQSDIMYSIPIINPSGDDAGFTGYFAEGKFVFSNIHEYPVGTTVNIEGKLYSVIEKNYVAPLED